MDHRELVQTVYDHFRTTGHWPLVRDLLVELRPVNVRMLAVDIGADRIGCESGPEGTCFLHLKAIAECRDSEEDIKNFLAAVRFMARRYIHGSRRIGGEDIDRELSLAPLASSRIGRLLPKETDFWSSWSTSINGALDTMEVQESVLRYEHVETLDQFFAVRERAKQEAAQRGVSVTTTLAWLAEMEDSVRRSIIVRDVIRPNLALLQKHHVLLLIGSDQFRETSASEADILVQLGLFTPLEALRAWSIDTPKAIFPGRRIGDLAVGAEASFIVLAGDPIADFSNVHRISLRMKQGGLLRLQDPAPKFPPLP